MKWFTPYCFMLIASMSTSAILYAQETLPKFKVKDLGKQGVQVSWLNPFKNCRQLSVQRSTDSLQFKTISHAKNPKLYNNGYIDKTGVARPLFYRIYYVLDGGKYFFSSIQSVRPNQSTQTNQSNQPNQVVSKPNENKWQPSSYVFCNGKGTPTILLPNASDHLYRLVFKEENGTTIFEINPIKDTETYLDKANFVHTGWFQFDLYEDGQLMEKGKILIQKEGASR